MSQFAFALVYCWLLFAHISTRGASALSYATKVSADGDLRYGASLNSCTDSCVFPTVDPAPSSEKQSLLFDGTTPRLFGVFANFWESNIVVSLWPNAITLSLRRSSSNSYYLLRDATLQCSNRFANYSKCTLMYTFVPLNRSAREIVINKKAQWQQTVDMSRTALNIVFPVTDQVGRGTRASGMNVRLQDTDTAIYSAVESIIFQMPRAAVSFPDPLVPLQNTFLQVGDAPQTHFSCTETNVTEAWFRTTPLVISEVALTKLMSTFDNNASPECLSTKTVRGHRVTLNGTWTSSLQGGSNPYSGNYTIHRFHLMQEEPPLDSAIMWPMVSTLIALVASAIYYVGWLIYSRFFWESDVRDTWSNPVSGQHVFGSGSTSHEEVQTDTNAAADKETSKN